MFIKRNERHRFTNQKQHVKMGVHSYFYKNQKHTPLEIGKIYFFSVVPFQKFPIFYICVFSENAQCFVGAFLLNDYWKYKNVNI